MGRLDSPRHGSGTFVPQLSLDVGPGAGQQDLLDQRLCHLAPLPAEAHGTYLKENPVSAAKNI